MRTLAVCLALTLPAFTAASAGSHTDTQRSKRATPAAAHPAVATCQLGCHIHRERAAVRWLRHRIVKRSRAALLPTPRSAHLSWRASQVRKELAWWSKTDRRTRRLASVPLSARIPRWHEWQCIAHYESMNTWTMSPSTSPGSGGAYWGGLQMDIGFMHTYGEDMIERHHGGLADTWTAAEQITVANRAWQTRGYEPWPNTSRMCGLR
jgi:Transglycosylase-like domain